MLVLSRKAKQSIHIGHSIEVVVLEIDEGRVKLGIAAPKSTAIIRDNAVRVAIKEGTLSQLEQRFDAEDNQP